MMKNEKNTVLEALRENNNRIFALVDDFEALYDVDLETGEYEYFIKGETYSSHIQSQIVERKEFFSDSVANIDRVVVPEDRKIVKKLFDRKYIRNVLAKTSHFDWHYRLLVNGKPAWFRMRIVYKDETNKRIIVGVFNAAEEMRQKEIAEAASLQRKKIIKKMLSGNTLYVVNPLEKTFEPISQDPEYVERYGLGSGDPFEALELYIEKDVFEPDREMLRNALTPENVIEHLRREGRYFLDYREISFGGPRWFRMSAIKFSDKEVLVGFADMDREILEQRIFEKSSDDSFALFVIDLDYESIKILKKSPWYDKGEVGRSGNFVAEMRLFASNLQGEAKEFFLNLSDVDFVRSELTNAEKQSFYYQSPMINNQWVMVRLYVLYRHDDGTPASFSLSFSLVDEMGRKMIRE